MALIKCLECQSEVSDQAPTCPKCGFPFKKESSSPETVQRVVVDQVKNVELTSKKWKIMKLIFWPMLIFGAFIFLAGLPAMMMTATLPGGTTSPSNSLATFAIGGLLAFIGFVGVVVATLGAWWNHK